MWPVAVPAHEDGAAAHREDLYALPPHFWSPLLLVCHPPTPFVGEHVITRHDVSLLLLRRLFLRLEGFSTLRRGCYLQGWLLCSLVLFAQSLLLAARVT